MAEHTIQYVYMDTVLKGECIATYIAPAKKEKRKKMHLISTLVHSRTI